MPLEPYRRVLAVPTVRSVLLLGLLIRVPFFAGSVILTLHVVGTLHRSYSQAGVLAAAATMCIAVSGPWRGRLLDRRGLRQVVLPCVLVGGACWSLAPFLGYWPLLLLASLAGLFVVPTFSVIRQAVILAASDADRRTALSMDAVAVEVSYMAGPLLGVWLAGIWPTSWVLFTIEMSSVAAGLLLWVANPAIRGDAANAPAAQDRTCSPRGLWTPALMVVLGAAAACTIVLSGSDVALVAALRSWHDVASLGLVIAVWGLGSIVGGLAYGALRRDLPVFALLAALGATTLPIALVAGVPALVALIFLAGLFCAPTITATVDAVSRVVPAATRGEAMGWHGSAMTAGSALGAPVAGYAIDRYGFGGGFASVALIGLAAAGLGTLVGQLGRRRTAAASLTPAPPPALEVDRPARSIR